MSEEEQLAWAMRESTAMATSNTTTDAAERPTPRRAPPPLPEFASVDATLQWAATHYKPEVATSLTAPPTTTSAGLGGARAAAGTLDLVQRDRLTMATFTPPQTRKSAAPPTHGAHCLVIDVSFSMEAAATVKSLEGDSIDHGFTMLDIAKHAMCTYVASLAAGDFVCIASYATEAKRIIEWTSCDEEGKAKLFAAIKGLQEEGSTNLTAGIATGLRAFEQELPAAVAANPSDYALLLAIATDGQPSNDTHPPGGPTGYAAFVSDRANAVAAAHGPAAVPALITIGLGNDLDSRLLSSFSDHFLHIPDPGSVGPFMVNLLAATRSTARIASNAIPVMDDGVLDVSDTTATMSSVARLQRSGTVDIASTEKKSAVANRAVLRLSPASAVLAVPGYRSVIVGDEVHVALGGMIYDQPRHVIILSPEGGSPDFGTDAPQISSAMVCVGDAMLATSGAPTPVAEGGDRVAASFSAELGRTAAVCALDLQGQRLSIVDGLGAPKDEVAARLAREGGRFGDVTVSLVWNDETDLDLHVTIPSGETLSYQNKKSRDGNVELDIDMNAGGMKSKEPVENVFAGDAAKGIEAPRGKYKVRVHNYAYHSSEGLPTPRRIEFKVSVRMHGDVSEYSGVISGAGEWVDVIEFDYSGAMEGAAEATMVLQEQKRKRDADKARLSAVPTTLLKQVTDLLPSGCSTLKQTLTDEALLAVQPDKFATWGKHYLVTLPQMLKAERRSNFRDAALQAFGQDASGKEAFFEELSSEAELCFAQLEPPAPSGLERLARKEAHNSARAAAAAARPAMTAMPDEFMRGGGCFAPDALVRCVGEEDEMEDRDLPIAALVPGMRVRTASGAAVAVRCLVTSPCEGGVTTLSALPGGLQLTEWHPLIDPRHGKWRFPHMLGTRVVRSVPAVYNLVLAEEHVAMVGGFPCATLGHGIEGPVIGHPFWGTRAVIDELARQPGWESGRVVLGAPLRSPA